VTEPHTTSGQLTEPRERRGWASRKAASFEEPVIREMSRLCAASGGVNLAQGFPA